MLATTTKMGFLDKVKAKFASTSQENLFLFGILGITLCLIIGLTVGIVLSQNDRSALGSYARAVDLLEKYPLIDG